MTTTILFAGGEDSEFSPVGGSSAVGTASGFFRSSYARCYLEVQTTPSDHGWHSQLGFSASTLWFSARHLTTGSASGGWDNAPCLTFYDASAIPRIRLRANQSAGTYHFEKLDSTGAETQLGAAFTFSNDGVSIDKLDVFIHDDASGAIQFYVNGILVMSFSGDTTTDSVSTLTSVRLGCFFQSSSKHSRWSEIIVADGDTRSMSLQTLAPVANGNTHNFDVGSPAASNVNEVTLNDLTIDGSDTAGQIDQYTIPSIVGGTFSIVAFGVSARLAKQSTGPSKMDLNVRSSSTDYFSSDKSLTTSFALYQNWWATDPATSAAWAALPVNIGLKSVT